MIFVGSGEVAIEDMAVGSTKEINVYGLEKETSVEEFIDERLWISSKYNEYGG